MSGTDAILAIAFIFSTLSLGGTFLALWATLHESGPRTVNHYYEHENPAKPLPKS